MKKLYFNGNIHTMDWYTPRADAVITEGNSFIFVGSEADARKILENTDFEEFNLDGRFVMPGLNDSHIHLLLYSVSCASIDLVGCKSIDEIKRRMKQGLKEKGLDKDGWLRGEGWLNELFSDDTRFPNRYDLDEISKDIPILAGRACMHNGVLNSAGLKYLGLEKDNVKNYGNQAEKDGNGEPNGIIKEKIMFRLTADLAFSNEESIKRALTEIIPQLHEQGITSVHSDNIRTIKNYDCEMYFNAIRNMEDSGALKIRIAEQVSLSDEYNELWERLKQFFAKGYNRDWGNDKFRVSHIKIVTDGNLGGKTAALRKPYANDSKTQGILDYTEEEFNKIVQLAQKHGCPIAAHAIGDKAIEMCLDAIDNACGNSGDNRIRHGIIHCQITDDGLLKKFAKTGALAMVQPIHIDYDMQIVKEYVGEQLADTSYSYKTLDDSGVHVSFGTDCPIEPFTTMSNLYTAVTRKNVAGDKKQIYRPDQRMSMERALRAYTIEGAYVSGEENIKGSIAVGKLADFIVLDHDLMNLDNEKQILETKVLATIFDGTVVFDRNNTLTSK